MKTRSSAALRSGKPADSLPDFAMNEGGCDGRPAHQPTWPVLFGRDVSQRRASFEEGLLNGLVIAVDDPYRGIPLGDVGEPLQPFRIEANPGVGQGDPVMPGFGESHVASPTRGRVPRSHDPIPGVLRRQSLGQGDRLVGRAPVDQDDLIGLAGLPRDRCDELADRHLLVADRNDKADTRQGPVRRFAVRLTHVARFPRNIVHKTFRTAV